MMMSALPTAENIKYINKECPKKINQILNTFNTIKII